MLYLKFVICLIVLCSLCGCAANLRQASPDAIAQTVKKSMMDAGNDIVWRAPELQISHYRTLFYGYDSVYYRLGARKSPKGDDILYQLSIDAQYGGSLRHYDAVKFANGTSRPLVSQSHQTQRCQFFNNLVYACLFRDQANVELSRSALEAFQTSGLLLKLGSEKQEYETIDLPGNYIKGFLQAVH